MKISKDITALDNSKRKNAFILSEAVFEKVKNPRTLSRNMKYNNIDDEVTGVDDHTFDEDLKPLMSFLNKLKWKKEKEVKEGHFKK